MKPRVAWVAGGVALAAACGASRSPEPSNAPPVTAAAPATHFEPTGTAAAPPVDAGAAADADADADADALRAAGERCGELDCRAFDTAEHAFNVVLAERPLVLAIGEAHAQKATQGIVSSTRRFTEQLLPSLEGRATDLVLELWLASGRCGPQEKQVAKQQKEVTATQAENNQNEFLTLGHASKARGIVPHVLKPNCDEYQRIASAGASDIATMLEMIARLTADKLEALLAERAAATTGRMLVAYGGALHNDVEPRAERQAWSFGPRLVRSTAGRYVELDLVVPELIGDGPAWKALPWVAHYDRERHGKKVTLFRAGPRSYTLVFSAGRAR